MRRWHGSCLGGLLYWYASVTVPKFEPQFFFDTARKGNPLRNDLEPERPERSSHAVRTRDRPVTFVENPRRSDLFLTLYNGSRLWFRFRMASSRCLDCTLDLFLLFNFNLEPTRGQRMMECYCTVYMKV